MTSINYFRAKPLYNIEGIWGSAIPSGLAESTVQLHGIVGQTIERIRAAVEPGGTTTSNTVYDASGNNTACGNNYVAPVKGRKLVDFREFVLVGFTTD